MTNLLAEKNTKTFMSLLSNTAEGVMSLDSIGQNLLHALQWEQHDFEVTDKQQRWDLNPQEAEAVGKWITARIEELKKIRGD